MTTISPEICLKIKAARRACGLSQSVLANEVGCKQSALSMFEQGQPTKLNDDVVEKLAKKFGIALIAPPDKPVESPAPVATHPPHEGFCPNPHCPSNHAYTVDGITRYTPDRVAADPVGGRFCALCGELLETRCPNCGSPVHSGSFCSLCGEPYIARA